MADEQVLTQDEVNALLNAVNTGELDAGIVPEQQTPETVRKHYKKYDFSGVGNISKEHSWAMNMLHQHFARTFSSSLSGLLRTLTEVECDTVEQLTYSDFVMSLSDPSCLCILSISPMHGSVVMEISPDLVFPLIEKLLGGRGGRAFPRRPMTEIEKEIMKQMIDLIIRDLGTTWQRVKKEIGFQLDTIETQSDYIQIVSPSDTVMLVVLSVKFAPAAGMISICYPFTTIELALHEARSDEWLFSPATQTADKDEEYRPKVQRNVDRAQVPLRVVFPSTQIPLRELMNLEVGHLLELDVRVENKKLMEPVVVEVAHRPRFLAKWGKLGRRNAAKIISVIDEDDVSTEQI